MDIKQISEQLSVSPQLLPSELPDVAAAGFKSIICNRPDGEADDQPAFADIEAAATANGLAVRYIPVTPELMSPELAATFGQAVSELPGPILAYCRTGNRSAMMWSMSQAAQAGA